MGKKSKVFKQKEEKSQQLQADQSEDEESNSESESQQPQNEQLLALIDAQMNNSSQPLKLTWSAIHKLHQQQISIDTQMNQQVKAIIQKYKLQKNQINHQIAQVASGKLIDKQIYTQHHLNKQLNVNQNQPVPVPHFWKYTLGTAGFDQCEYDSTLLSNCTNFQCNYKKTGKGEEKQQQIQVIFHFRDNDYIENTTLKLNVLKKGKQYFRNQVTSIKFKKQPPINSVIAQVFNSSITPKKLFTISSDLHRVYNDSLYNYFYHLMQKTKPIQITHKDNDDDDDDEYEIPQPTKRRYKKNTQFQQNKHQNKALEKPQCKNQ